MNTRNKIKKNIKVAIYIFVGAFCSLNFAQAQVRAVTMPKQILVNPGVQPRPLPVPPLPKPTPIPYFEYVKININHQEQERMLCVPTSASMMLSKFGWNYPPRQIKLATRSLPYYGPNTYFNDWTPMNMFSLMNGLRYLGINNWRAEFYSLSDFDRGLSNIKNSLKMGYPVMLLITFGGPVGHAVVVSGFDDRNQRIIVNDPAMIKPGINYYSYADLKNKYWTSRMSSRGAVFMNPTQPAARATTTTVNQSMYLNY